MTKVVAMHRGDGVIAAELASRWDELTRLYETGRDAKRWEHAEEFIERLEYGVLFAPHGEALWSEFQALAKEINLDMSYVASDVMVQARDDARSLLTAEIADFTMGAHHDMERWTPYVSWAHSLHPSDTVVTFNYDIVPDILAEAPGVQLHIPTAFPSGAATPSKATVIKIHGSVNWRLRPHGGLTTTDRHPLDDANGKPVAIATPGPSKKRLVSDAGIFATLRGHAGAAIREASAIVVVGYSLPATDAETKDWLLKMLRHRAEKYPTNNSEEPISVHLVLGPDRTTGHAERLIGLFKSVSSRFTIANWYVRAEDFLGLRTRKELSAPPSSIAGFVEVHASK